MSFLGNFFKAGMQIQDEPQRINEKNIQWIATGTEAEALITNITKLGPLEIVIEQSDDAERLQTHLTDAGFLLICPNSLSELQTILQTLKDYFSEHQNTICRVVTNQAEIINAVENKSCLLYPPTAETLKSFYQKLNDIAQSKIFFENSEKENMEYALLSPLPSQFFSALQHHTELNYPVLHNAKSHSVPQP